MSSSYNPNLSSAVETVVLISQRQNNVVPSPHRSVASLLRVGIPLGVLAFMLLFPRPAMAGCVGENDVECTPDEAEYRDGIYYVNEKPDTRVYVTLDPAKDIVTSGNHGVAIYNFSGNAFLLGSSNDITTSGDNASGAIVASYGGHAGVSIGKVHTRGDWSLGVNVVGTGFANVQADSVVTEGDHSAGIAVLARDGIASAYVNSVTTHGVEAIGISIGAEQFDPTLPFASGSVEVRAGSVSTFGDGSTGIDFSTGVLSGRADVVVNEVQTSGDYAAGIRGTGIGASMIKASSVTTSGDDSTGIFSDKYLGNEEIIVGSVATVGARSHGITAFNQYGNIRTIAGTVATHGDESDGIFQRNLNGSVLVDARQITTSGSHANGVTSYSVFDRAEAVIGKVETSGYASAGVFVAGGKGLTASISEVRTSGDDSVGVRLITGTAGVGLPTLKGDLVATIGSVATSGAYATGVSVTAFGGLDLAIGTVHTSGEGAIGVFTNVTEFDPQKLRVERVVTEGDLATGILIGQRVATPDGTIDAVIGEVTTMGNGASAIMIDQALTEAKVMSVGAVTTSGDYSHGFDLSYSRAGSVEIVAAGKIVTSGDGARGITASPWGATTLITAADIETSGANAAAISVDLLIPASAIENQLSSVDILAGAIRTSGDGAHGIDISVVRETDDGGVGGAATALAPPGDVFVKSGLISVSGLDSIGIRINSVGTARIETGDTLSRHAAAIELATLEAAELLVGGRTEAGGTTAVSIMGADVTVGIGRDGSITGPTDALVVSAKGYLPPPDDGGEGGVGVDFRVSSATGGGAAVIDNAGSIRADGGDAIRVLAGEATITNRGLIAGGITLAGGNDSLLNSGALELQRTIDFGTGSDILVNSGTVRLRPAAARPVTIALRGLERFDNAGGSIDLRNGAAGDIVSLSGGYVASGNATLALDIGGNAADHLVIAGAASGKTKILLNPLRAGQAMLLGAPLTLVSTGAGSQADAFTLAETADGFVRYDLQQERASGRYRLTTQASASVYRLGKLQDGLQALGLRTTDAWSAHMADVQDKGGGGARLWGQAFGGVETRDQQRVIAGDAEDLETRQDIYGTQLGYDLIAAEDANAPRAGLTATYLSSKQRFDVGSEKARFETIGLGVYGGVQAGVLFLNLLGHYDHNWTKLSDAALNWSDRVQGDSVGLSGEVGARLGDERLFVVPAVSLAWQRSQLDDVQALGQSIAFDDANGLRGKAGVRVGGMTGTTGSRLIYYASGRYVHEFAGEGRFTLVSNGVSQSITNHRIGDYGEVGLGLRLELSARVSAFAEGVANIGEVSGGNGRAGIRVGF